jgi:3-phenylpropionate/trans-cinnamate dioxygenase ferredoxin reductase subunit
MSKKVVIIGAGHGGIQVVASLREEGFDGEIVLIASEKEMPYQKPPLSKGYLQGKQSEEAILFRTSYLLRK